MENSIGPRTEPCGTPEVHAMCQRSRTTQCACLDYASALSVASPLLIVAIHIHNGNVSIGGLGAGRIAYCLEECGLQNRTCGLFSLKPRCDNSAVNF